MWPVNWTNAKSCHLAASQGDSKKHVGLVMQKGPWCPEFVVIPKEEWPCVATPVLLLVWHWLFRFFFFSLFFSFSFFFFKLVSYKQWQWLRTLGTFSLNAKHVGLRGYWQVVVQVTEGKEVSLISHVWINMSKFNTTDNNKNAWIGLIARSDGETILQVSHDFFKEVIQCVIRCHFYVQFTRGWWKIESIKRAL